MSAKQNKPGKSKFSQTMRIDIAPESSGPHDDQADGGKPKFSQTMRIDIPPESQELQTAQAPVTPRKAKVPPKQVDTAAKVRVKTGSTKAPPTLPPADSDFQQLLQSVYDAALITDMNGAIVDANIRAEDFLHYSKEEFCRMSIVDVISGVDETTLARICEHLDERFVLIESCLCTRKDQSNFPAEIAVNQLRLSGQDYLCFFVRDIHRRKEAEDRLRIEHNAIHNSHGGIAITDLKGTIQYANPAVCRMWGYDTAEELEGENVRELSTQEGDEDDPIATLTQQEKGVWSQEFTVDKNDGSTFDVQITAAAIRDADEKPVSLVFSFFDTSDRKRAEEAVRETDRHRVMLESLGAACHHLGQPATVLVANLGIIQRKATDNTDEQMTDMVGSCVEAADALSSILHKLNAVNEYRTTPYLESRTGDDDQNRIIEIE